MSENDEIGELTRCMAEAIPAVVLLMIGFVLAVVVFDSVAQRWI
jgi:hypothetical protein